MAKDSDNDDKPGEARDSDMDPETRGQQPPALDPEGVNEAELPALPPLPEDGERRPRAGQAGQQPRTPMSGEQAERIERKLDELREALGLTEDDGEAPNEQSHGGIEIDETQITPLIEDAELA